MFGVTLHSYFIHALFGFSRKIRVRFKLLSHSLQLIRVLFKLLSHFVLPPKRQERPGTATSKKFQVLFRLEVASQLQRLTIHISFRLCSHSHFVHSLFKFNRQYRLVVVSGDRPKLRLVQKGGTISDEFAV